MAPGIGDGAHLICIGDETCQSHVKRQDNLGRGSGLQMRIEHRLLWLRGRADGLRCHSLALNDVGLELGQNALLLAPVQVLHLMDCEPSADLHASDGPCALN